MPLCFASLSRIVETRKTKEEDLATTAESQRLLSEMEALLERAKEIVRRYSKSADAEPLETKPQPDPKQ